LKPYDTIVIGDANIDLIVAGCNEIPGPGQEVLVRDMTLHVGGGAALFSLAIAKLGLQVAFNGIVGADGFGQFVKDQFALHGIDTRYIRSSTLNHTGISIAINPENDRSFITYLGTNSELSLAELDMNSVALGRHVHLTGYRGRRNHSEYMNTARELKRFGVTTSIDVGWDETGEWYSGVFELMAAVDVFFMNEMEAASYTDRSSAAAALTELAKHSGHIVLKLGPEGAVAAVNGRTAYRSGFPVPVVDTTGAGDSFNAGYIYGFLNGQPVERCLLFGNACGAMSVSRYGGSSGTPDKEAMDAFIAERVGLTRDEWAGGA